ALPTTPEPCAQQALITQGLRRILLTINSASSAQHQFKLLLFAGLLGSRLGDWIGQRCAHGLRDKSYQMSIPSVFNLIAEHVAQLQDGGVSLDGAALNEIIDLLPAGADFQHAREVRR